MSKKRMGEPIINVRGLSKIYRVRRARPTLRAWWRGGEDAAPAKYALREIGFSIGNGEAVGIIGANGAGKTTLLKVLSRIIEPSAGEMQMCGTVAPFLGLGAAFHPDLPGRENIYLLGAILGMRRAEVRANFAAIVEMAQARDILDMPVKHYSSGCYIRLALAAAAHLRSDILLVDEALAVADAAFQTFYLERLAQMVKEGRTILFVSHDDSAVRKLCPRSLVLAQGSLAYDGPTENALQIYSRL